MKIENLEQLVIAFKNESQEKNHRYTSFDYCYNYFHPTNNSKQDIEKSCLVLGFYLASWGMFRGSSFLLNHNAKHFQQTIEYINKQDKSLWDIDVNNYREKKDIIIQIYGEVKSKLIPKNNTDLTLVTKVLLGVFGIVPAYDRYFCDAFRSYYNNCGFRRLNLQSLSLIEEFYNSHQSEIDSLASKTYTIDFLTGNPSNINYPKAKIIDMIGFIDGKKMDKNNL